MWSVECLGGTCTPKAFGPIPPWRLSCGFQVPCLQRWYSMLTSAHTTSLAWVVDTTPEPLSYLLDAYLLLSLCCCCPVLLRLFDSIESHCCSAPDVRRLYSVRTSVPLVSVLRRVRGGVDSVVSAESELEPRSCHHALQRLRC